VVVFIASNLASPVTGSVWGGDGGSIRSIISPSGAWAWPAAHHCRCRHLEHLRRGGAPTERITFHGPVAVLFGEMRADLIGGGIRKRPRQRHAVLWLWHDDARKFFAFQGTARPAASASASAAEVAPAVLSSLYLGARGWPQMGARPADHIQRHPPGAGSVFPRPSHLVFQVVVHEGSVGFRAVVSANSRALPATRVLTQAEDRTNSVDHERVEALVTHGPLL
jgi:hypothetical protein